ncbi:hypothetical protein [Rothia terrae]|uniref:hypothetical protein n=1 Tax=Rothia terrae TaxID=396015 RepID=UPI0028822CB8|nr:hypothetical protein [Rothia terrae]MDT0190071.1 hypothetical protein [Rothia terrae]
MRNRWSIVAAVLAVLTVILLATGIFSTQKKQSLQDQLADEHQLAQQIENLSSVAITDTQAKKSLDEMLNQQKSQLPDAAFTDVEAHASDGLSSGITDAISSATDISVNSSDASARALATDFTAQWLDFADTQKLNGFSASQALVSVKDAASNATCPAEEKNAEDQQTAEGTDSLTALVQSLDAAGYLASVTNARADVDNTDSALAQRIESRGQEAQNISENLRTSTECAVAPIAQLPGYDLSNDSPSASFDSLETRIHDNALAFLGDEKFSGENFRSARANAVLAATEF